MSTTTNLQLIKPDEEDFYDISVFNTNADIIDEEITELKKSVSDGKTLVANAITAKGVSTSKDATFQTMATNIENIVVEDNTMSSYNLFTQMEEPEIKEGIWVQTSDNFERVIIDNHTLNEGGAWNASISDVPYDFKGGSVVVYKGEIHILGGDVNLKKHYKLVGDSWVSVSTLPYYFYYGCAVVYDDEIHIFGSAYPDDTGKHYSWNGTSWTLRYDSLFESDNASAVVWNNEIHLFGGGSDWQQKHYRWNGTSWKLESEGIGYSTTKSSAVVYEGKIHVLGNGVSDNAYSKDHKVFDGTSWTNSKDLPYGFVRGSAVVYNGEMHIFGSSIESNRKNHYKWDGEQWISVSTLPFNFYNGGAVVVGNSIHLVGGIPGSSGVKNYRASFTSPENMFSPHTMIIQRGNTQNGAYLTSITDTSAITGENNRFLSGFDDVWYYGESSFEMNDPMYYGNGTSWVKFKN